MFWHVLYLYSLLWFITSLISFLYTLGHVWNDMPHKCDMLYYYKAVHSIQANAQVGSMTSKQNSITFTYMWHAGCALGP